MLKEINIKVTAEEVEKLTAEELAELVQFRLSKAIFKELKGARDEKKQDKKPRNNRSIKRLYFRINHRIKKGVKICVQI